MATFFHLTTQAARLKRRVHAASWSAVVLTARRDTGRIATTLSSGRDPGDPSLAEQRDIALEHFDAMLAHYGRDLGLKNARKHVGWYLASSGADTATVKSWRAQLCTALEPQRVLAGLAAFYSGREPLTA